MINYLRYDQQMVESIGIGLEQYKTATELAMALGVDVSGLIKHIKKHRYLNETAVFNKCGRKKQCHITNVCDKCPYTPYRQDSKECAYCHKSNCNQKCSLFTKIPQCDKIKKFPYTCNGCSKIAYCHFNHFLYDPQVTWKNILLERSNPRKGTHADEGEFNRLSKLFVPLIKEKHQSLPQIFLTHKEEIRWSYPTILKFINDGLIPGVKNIDLTKRVRYPAHYKKKQDEPTNYAFLTNRTYDDFVAYISDNSFMEVVEMDTVLSCKNVNTCLLTLLFRKSNFMLAFLLKSKSTTEVEKLFRWIRSELGIELYQKTFACILTDNGSEFADPKSIEFDDETGVRLCRLFYCDPGKSGQKGKIEKNHVELRKVFPKGCDLSVFNQNQVNIALSHVNSTPRGILNGNYPGIIAKVFLDEKVLGLNEYKFVDPDSVNLHPNLLK